MNLLCMRQNHCSYTVAILVIHCSRTVAILFTHLKILKIGHTALFTHLKIILLQYFQFSVLVKISSIQTDPIC